MEPATFANVDRYLSESLSLSDPVLEAALADSTAAGLPSINVAPNQGKFLQLLARMVGAKKILEIGTLGGYSTIWLGRALPDGGKMVTLEYEPKHAAVAKANIARAQLAEKVEQHVGRAIDILPKLEAAGGGPFDFIFIDADKPSIPDYFTWSLKLSRPGTAIVVDNVIRSGKVADLTSADEAVRGVQRLNRMLAAEKRVSATTIQTVGAKGYDGFTLALVNG